MNKIIRLLRFDWPLHFVLLLTNWLPDNVLFLRIRGAIARPFFSSCGKNLRLGRNLTFYNPSKIIIGCNVYLAYGSWFMAGEVISINDEVLIGPYCVIVSSNHQATNNSFRYGTSEILPITISKGCWVGAHVTLTAGTFLGDGCLVAAGAVVIGEFANGIKLGGVPAREI